MKNVYVVEVNSRSGEINRVFLHFTPPYRHQISKTWEEAGRVKQIRQVGCLLGVGSPVRVSRARLPP